MHMTVSWMAKPWHSAYQQGAIRNLSNDMPSITSVHRHHKTKSIRISTVDADWPLADAVVSINGTLTGMRRRGRFGRLHIGESE